VTPAVQLQDVQVVAGGRVLLEVPRLEIAAGERVAIVGPNGAGKSTLLKVMAVAVAAQRGEVRVLGRAVGAAAALTRRERQALRAEIGLLMQHLHLVPRLTARENVLVGALASLQGVAAWRSLLRWYPAACIARADAALAALGLAERTQTRADRLSGGERQKVALARLQLQQPRLLLADEPTSALDPSATARVCDALRAASAGRTLVTVLHDLELLPRLADRVIGMAGGGIAWDRPRAEVPAALLRALYETPDKESPDERRTHDGQPRGAGPELSAALPL